MENRADRGLGVTHTIFSQLRDAAVAAAAPSDAIGKLKLQLEQEEAGCLANWRERGSQIERLEESIRNSGNGAAFRQFRLWHEYLAMKSSTNESHDVYRAFTLAWLAHVGYEPHFDEPLVATHDALASWESKLGVTSARATLHDEASVTAIESAPETARSNRYHRMFEPPRYPLTLTEHPEVYLRVLRPLYKRLGIPSTLVWHWQGRSEFLNGAGRKGMVKLLTVERGHGAFLLHPNPGYHDPHTVQLHEEMGQKALLSTVKGPRHDGLPTKESGYALIAWWVPPDWVPSVSEWLTELKEKRGPAPSEPASRANYTCSSVPRCEGYLHTMRDLRAARDLPLLHALLESSNEWLGDLGAPEVVFCHYPPATYYSTLHFHIRTLRYPYAQPSSRRSNFYLEELISKLKRSDTGGFCGDGDRLTLGFMKADNMGFKIHEEHCPFLMREAAPGEWVVADSCGGTTCDV
ncbi:unnamed protein product [Vitrella brassicaformis CCMP3155]|uniref:Uncharacterized protein n=1 Tax=Vitrella brassicaformis (strain CCMP3155) TaxID=1169540 RepID=A0A0G4EH13_VITBC|nr:unnamed protein product [Vitrella brassicaformis CCMP3155]|eukprot:CEL95759.1 unnamed protein product [Vitrella brassicaformis CCMP3155]